MRINGHSTADIVGSFQKSSALFQERAAAPIIHMSSATAEAIGGIPRLHMLFLGDD
jgi:hypothetical protein